MTTIARQRYDEASAHLARQLRSIMSHTPVELTHLRKGITEAEILVDDLDNLIDGDAPDLQEVVERTGFHLLGMCSWIISIAPLETPGLSTLTASATQAVLCANWRANEMANEPISVG